MKRRLLEGGVLLLLCAVGAWGLWNEGRKPRLKAAELVPSESLFLAECPDIPATVVRWKGTALAGIFAEPSVRAFLAKPLSHAGPEELARWRRIRPRQAFLAIASFSDGMPRAVAGLEYEGERRELEPLVGRAMIQAQNASPRGRIERLRYRGRRILAFQDRGITVAGCFAGDWYFVANDVELLKETLDRAFGKTHNVLAALPRYREARLALPARADFRLFWQTSHTSSRLLTGSPAGPAALKLPKISFVGAALASRFEGRFMRDTLLFFQPPSAAASPRLDGHTLALTTPDTVFYGAVAPRLEGWFSSGGASSPGPGRFIPMVLAALVPPGASTGLSHFQEAFGPEHALVLDWPSSSPEPALCLASEVRDALRARRFIASLLRTWEHVDGGGISIWAFSSSPSSLLHPAVALSGSHLMAGLSTESLRPFALHAAQSKGGGGASLERSPAFRGSLAGLERPETALAYLDAAIFFERLYAALRPAAILWAPSNPKLSGWADFSRLPPARAVSRHLSSISLSARRTAAGLVVESEGPVTFVEIGAGLGAAAFYALAPALRAKPTPEPGILPSPPLKPLSWPPEGEPGAKPRG